MATILDLDNKQILLVDKNKKVSMVEYEDGSAELFLDLPHDLMSFVYSESHKQDKSVQDVLLELISNSLKLLKDDDSFKSTVKTKIKKS